ncbi:MAG: hypothetical protein GYB21_07440 [Oceanospirillales bacterium]|nr:hypothetical protein [Oceanospirillales bacterium]
MSQQQTLHAAVQSRLGVRFSSPWLRVSDIPVPHRYHLVAEMLGAKPAALCRSADHEPCLRTRDYALWEGTHLKFGDSLPDPGLTEADLEALTATLSAMPHEREPRTLLADAWLVELDGGEEPPRWLAGGQVIFSEDAFAEHPELPQGSLLCSNDLVGAWVDDDRAVIAYDIRGEVYRLLPDVFIARLDPCHEPLLCAGEHPSELVMADVLEGLAATADESDRIHQQPVKCTFAWGELAELLDDEGNLMFVTLWGAEEGNQGRWIRTSDVQQVTEGLPVRVKTLNSVYRVMLPLTTYRLPHAFAWELLNTGFSPAEVTWLLTFKAPDAKDAAPDAGESGEGDDKDP